MNAIIPAPSATLVLQSGVPAFLDQIRPEWQAKRLVERVRLILPVDPSSACQRLINAAIHDLKDKIRAVGLDLADEAALQNGLPRIGNDDDLDAYSTHNIIQLAYRIGILSHADWRRVSRCYEIRRDLEHEDDRYEAGVEDCVYIFKTCIEVILAKDPIQLIRVGDVRNLVEQANPAVPDATVIEDFTALPQVRQEQILQMLISLALDQSQPDLVQQNAHRFLNYLSPAARQPSIVTVGRAFQERVGRQLTERDVRVAQAARVFPYIRNSAKVAFFELQWEQFRRVGTNWGAYNHHGDILRTFKDCGGLDACPDELVGNFLKWMMLTFIGTPGGQTQFGNIRHVYFSNSASPIIREMLTAPSQKIKDLFLALLEDANVMSAQSTTHIIRRMETLVDLVEQA